MIDKYVSRIGTLSQEEAGLVAQQLIIYRLIRIDRTPEIASGVTPERLSTLLRGCHILGADVVAALLPIPGPIAQNALEKILGRPITCLPPQSSPPPAPRHEGAPPVVQDVGPSGRRTIHRIVTNPKRPGTGAYTRYNLYREGGTVAEYLAGGGELRDVSWDSRQGFIEVRDPGPPSRRPNPAAAQEGSACQVP